MDDNFLSRDLQRWIEDQEKLGFYVTEEAAKRHVAETKSALNTKPDPELNGFSNLQMHMMLNFPLEEGCPVQLRTLTEEEIFQIPFMRQVLFLMKALQEKELKLTSKGNLPVKMVEELYQMGSHSRYSDLYAQKKEERCREVELVRVTLEHTSLIKKRQGKMTLTAKGKKLLKNPNELLRTIMVFLLWDFNTGFLDGWDDTETANIGRMYSLWLLHHYGKQWRSFKVYERDYFRAFTLLRDRESYSYRILDGLFRIIGLCEINELPEQAGPYLNEEVRKSPILDMMFTFEEPAKIRK